MKPIAFMQVFLPIAALLAVGEARTQPPPRNGRIICSENVLPEQGNLSRIVSYASDGSDRTYLTTSGIGLSPSVSRDGKRIYYSSGDVTTGFNIWVMNIDGSGKKQLTSGPGLTAQPAESPDGAQIAYVSRSRTSRFPAIWVMNLDGTNTKELATTDRPGDPKLTWTSRPTWSADGKKIAYASTETGATQIWIMNADGTNKKQLTFGLGTDFPDANVPAFSYDGTKIAFWSGVERQRGEVWMMNPDGTHPQRITNTPVGSNSDDPAWAPDGRKVIFARGSGGAIPRQMYVVDLVTKTLTLVTDLGVDLCVWQPRS